MLRHAALDLFDRHLAVRGAQDIGEAVLRQLQRDLAPDEAGEGEAGRGGLLGSQEAFGRLLADAPILAGRDFAVRHPRSRFQKRRMAGDLDLVTRDSTTPHLGGSVFPKPRRKTHSNM